MDSKDSARNSTSKTSSRYWENRLYKRSYKGSDGQNVQLADWYVTLCHKGEDQRVCLQTPNKALAAKKALDAYLLLKSQGWDALWDAYKVRKSKNDEKNKEECSEQKIITIGDFINAIESKYSFRSLITFRKYLTSLYKLISDIFEIEAGREKYDYVNNGYKQRVEKIHSVEIGQLTSERIEEWKNESLKNKISKQSIERKSAIATVNSILRGCKNIFSSKILRAIGIDKDFISPFAGISYHKEESHRYVTRFDATELIRKAKDELKANFSNSYIIFLLAIGAGLRRNEIDKLLWEQVDLERGIISIYTTRYFTPKTQESSSEISLAPFIVNELKILKEINCNNEFVVNSKIQPKIGARYAHYRCVNDCEFLCNWLKRNGVDARNALHTLRKEFGAQICREYGLYMASRALRHSSYKMTESFYVDKTAAVVPGFFKKVSQ